MKKNKIKVFGAMLSTVLIFNTAVTSFAFNSDGTINKEYNKKIENNGNNLKTVKYTPEIDYDRMKSELEKSLNNEKRSSTGQVYLKEVSRVKVNTGFKRAGNQPNGGIDFGARGGVIGYTPGNNYSNSNISVSFSVGGAVSIGLGVGSKNDFSTGANVGPNEGYVHLYVNETKEIVRYRKERRLPNGQVLFEGYIESKPEYYSHKYEIRKVR